MDEDVFLGRRDSSDFLKQRGFVVSSRTLEKLACHGGGPIYRTFGRRAIYKPADLIKWAQARVSQPRTNTSEGSPHAGPADFSYLPQATRRRWVRAGIFPAPIERETRSHLWRHADVLAWANGERGTDPV